MLRQQARRGREEQRNEYHCEDDESGTEEEEQEEDGGVEEEQGEEDDEREEEEVETEENEANEEGEDTQEHEQQGERAVQGRKKIPISCPMQIHNVSHNHYIQVNNFTKNKKKSISNIRANAVAMDQGTLNSSSQGCTSVQGNARIGSANQNDQEPGSSQMDTSARGPDRRSKRKAINDTHDTTAETRPKRVSPNTPRRESEEDSDSEGGENEPESDDVFKSFAAEEQANIYMRKKNYSSAKAQLEEVSASKKHLEISMSLKMIECMVHLNSRRRVPKKIGKFVEAILAINPSDKDLVRLAAFYEKHGAHFKAIIMSRCASRSYATQRQPNDAYFNITQCLCQASKAVKGMSKSKAKRATDDKVRLRDIALDYGMPLMQEMLDDFRNIRGKHTPSKRADLEGGCLSWISSAYNYLNEFQRAINVCEEGIKSMEKKCGVQIRNYVQLLINRGYAHYILVNKNDAVQSYERALELIPTAKGYDPKDRSKTTRVIQSYLDQSRQMEA